MNPLQKLIHDHITDTGDTLADIATRGGLSRQTLSAVYHRADSTGIPRRRTLEHLATGLGLSSATVIDAAAQAAGHTEARSPLDYRLLTLVEVAQSLPAGQVDVLLATARALGRLPDDTP